MNYSNPLSERELFIKIGIPEILEAKKAVLITVDEKGEFRFSTYGIPEHDDSLDNFLIEARRHA